MPNGSVRMASSATTRGSCATWSRGSRWWSSCSLEANPAYRGEFIADLTELSARRLLVRW